MVRDRSLVDRSDERGAMSDFRFRLGTGSLDSGLSTVDVKHLARQIGEAANRQVQMVQEVRVLRALRSNDRNL